MLTDFLIFIIKPDVCKIKQINFSDYEITLSLIKLAMFICTDVIGSIGRAINPQDLFDYLVGICLVDVW